MAKLFDKFGSIFKKREDISVEDDYVELEADVKSTKAKINIRPFTLESYDDIKHVLDAIREGYTIALINIAPLKEKDKISLKRAIDKLKKTLEANDGDIAGFGENWLIATPSFATVHRAKAEAKPEIKVEGEEEAGDME
jgi:SepF-like predicted cell division protein (DUF552 family)